MIVLRTLDGPRARLELAQWNESVERFVTSNADELTPSRCAIVAQGDWGPELVEKVVTDPLCCEIFGGWIGVLEKLEPYLTPSMRALLTRKRKAPEYKVLPTKRCKTSGGFEQLLNVVASFAGQTCWSILRRVCRDWHGRVSMPLLLSLHHAHLRPCGHIAPWLRWATLEVRGHDDVTQLGSLARLERLSLRVHKGLPSRRLHEVWNKFFGTLATRAPRLKVFEFESLKCSLDVHRFSIPATLEVLSLDSVQLSSSVVWELMRSSLTEVSFQRVLLPFISGYPLYQLPFDVLPASVRRLRWISCSGSDGRALPVPFLPNLRLLRCEAAPWLPALPRLETLILEGHQQNSLPDLPELRELELVDCRLSRSVALCSNRLPRLQRILARPGQRSALKDFRTLVVSPSPSLSPSSLKSQES